MKSIEVVAAIIKDKDKIFATQRGYGEFINQWEFPGGKIEPGESKEEALKRELLEELNANISIDQFLLTIEYDYPTFHLTMHCYLCSLLNNTIYLKEHNDAVWISKDNLYSLDWLPADIAILPELEKLL